MKTALSLLAGLLVLGLATISVQNPDPVALRFFAWQTPLLPIWVIIVVALICGMAVGGMLTMPGRLFRARDTHQLRVNLDAARTTISSLEQAATLPSSQPSEITGIPQRSVTCRDMQGVFPRSRLMEGWVPRRRMTNQRTD